MSVRAVATIALGLVIAASARAIAHDIPNAIVVQAFLKPEGERLRFLVRVPLQAMRDIDVPQRGPGYLDLARAEDALRTAATVWIAREVALYEEETRLGAAELISVRVSLPSDRAFQEYDTALAHIAGPPLLVYTGGGQSVTSGPLGLTAKAMPPAVLGHSAIYVFALP